MMNETKCTWRPPYLTEQDYRDAEQHSVLCLVTRPDGRGQGKSTYQVVPITYDLAGRYYFCIDDAVVDAWTHLPKCKIFEGV